jgi:transposase
MIDLSNVIFVHTTFVDMRKSINGLAILVRLSGNVFEHGKAFIFLNKARDKIKILLKENNGFVLVYKRLDEGQFKLSFASKTALTLTRQQLRWLLEGLDYASLTPVKTGLFEHHF